MHCGQVGSNLSTEKQFVWFTIQHGNRATLSVISTNSANAQRAMLRPVGVAMTASASPHIPSRGEQLAAIDDAVIHIASDHKVGSMRCSA